MTNNQSKQFIISLVCGYCIYAYLSLNIVLPALPHLISLFKTTHVQIKFSVSMLLLGYSISQLLWGILSDHFGRRFIILLALIIAIIGSLLSGTANSIFVFSIARFIEGFGSGFGPALGRLVAKDTLDKKNLHICMTYIVSVVALMPAVGPIIGGQIMFWLGWRAILYALAVAGVLLYYVSYKYLSETISEEASHPLSLRTVFYDFANTIANKTYMGYFLAYSFTLSGLITFYMMAPYMFITHLGMHSSHYGFVLLFVGMSYMLSATANRRLVDKLSVNTLICIGYVFSFAAIASLIIFHSFIGMTIFTVILPASLFAISCGFISPTINAAAMSSIKGNAGVPVSLLSCGVMTVSTLSTGILAHFSYDTLLPLLFTYGIITVLSVLCYAKLIQRGKNK